MPALMVSGAGKVVKKLKKEREGEVSYFANRVFLAFRSLKREKTRYTGRRAGHHFVLKVD